MQDIVEQIVSYLKGIWVHKWAALVLVWGLCLIGWPFVLKMPNQYASEAKVYVDTQSLLAPLLRGLAIQTNSEQQVQLMIKTLLTRPNLEKITRLADLDIQAKNDAEFDVILTRLEDNIKLRQAGRENIYTISYTSSSAEEAQKVVQATLSTLVENTLGNKRQDSTSASNFLDRQIAEYESRLNQADNELKEFKQKNYELMGSNTGFYGRINSLKEQVRSIELELQEAQSRRDSIEQQLAGEEEPIFDMMDDGLSTHAFEFVSSYDGRIDTLENRLDQLRLKYTDIHPDIRETERILEDLQAKREQERREQQANQVAQEQELNPYYQQLKLSLANEKATVQSLEVRLAEYKRQLELLQINANTNLELEAQLQALQRGYSITQQKYNELLSRRESAHLTEQADSSANGFQFRIIDPPRRPSAPSGPNRPLFLSGVLAGAAVIGVGIAFLISQLRPVFFESRELFQITGYPVLGVISMIKDPELQRHKRREMLIFTSLAGFLLAVYGILISLQLSTGINQRLLAYVPDISNAGALQLKQLAYTLLSYS